MTSTIAIIGGTGLNRLSDVWEPVGHTATPYGPASCTVQRTRLGQRDVLFLARHGQPHRLPPHRINYRANVWLLRELGATAAVATNAVGGITAGMASGDVVIPHQIIDYTWGREHTYMDESHLVHVDFTAPYDPGLRDRLVAASRLPSSADRTWHGLGVYGCTQGPRLESAAEIDRMARDGCDVVGMTGMPEAGLAREIGLPYAAICLVVNRAAGRSGGTISEAEIIRIAEAGMGAIVETLRRALENP